MHPKISERRGAVLSEQLTQIDQDIEAVCLSLAERVRLAGSLCIGEAEAKSLESQFQASVAYIIRIPAASEEGKLARRELIRKLAELTDYLETLLGSPWTKSEMEARSQQDTDQNTASFGSDQVREYR